jgi:hypothetical protein
MKRQSTAIISACVLCAVSALATERHFTFTYEPETMPQGVLEFEQWVTLNAGRSAAVGQSDYYQWALREEFEYGVTDNYELSFYINTAWESYKDPVTGIIASSFDFEGVSLENKYMLLNPAEHAIGLTLYLEGTYSGSEVELEPKILIGQRCGKWKWAFNLINATEWNFDQGQIEGEFGATFGLARELGKHWNVGFECRNVSVLPRYQEWENTAFYVGPVINYTAERWWATFTILPQVYGADYTGNSGVQNLELVDNTRIATRLLLGISF